MAISVVHVLKSLGIGGTEKTAEIFCRELHKSGDFNVHLLYNARGADFHRLKNFRAFLPDEFVHGYQFEQQGVELLKHMRPDIVHVYRSGFDEWPNPSRDINPLSKFVETNVFGFTDENPRISRSLFMSEWLRGHAQRINPDPFDVDPERFDFVNNPIDKPVTDAKYVEMPGTVIVGRCGRPDDGIYDPISIQAMMMAQSLGFTVHFLVVAPPPRMVQDLNQYGIPHTIIEPTTDAETLSKFYNSIDIYCHSRADGETFGCNIAEAMIHGKPVITHVAKPSHPGMGVFQSQTTLVRDGRNGFVVENAQQYGRKLQHLIADRRVRERQGEESRKIAMAEYETSVVVNKLSKIYREVVKG